MAKRVTADTLAGAIQDILEEYADDIQGNMDEITRAVGKKGVQALKSESASKFGTVPGQDKKYAKSWAAKYETGRLSTTVIIYNRKPGLPHLLEFGHALRGGGRSGHVPGREHIAGVEEKLVKEFEDTVRRSI